MCTTWKHVSPLDLPPPPQGMEEEEDYSQEVAANSWLGVLQWILLLIS
jgi:hypothetical protein